MIGLRTYLYFSPNKLQGKRKTVVKCISSRVEINIPLTMIKACVVAGCIFVSGYKIGRKILKSLG